MLLFVRQVLILQLVSISLVAQDLDKKVKAAENNPPPASRRHEIHLKPDSLTDDQGRWTLTPGQEPKAALFRLPNALSAKRVRLKLEYLGGDAGNFFREFSISATREAKPTLSSAWQPLYAVWSRSSEGNLRRSSHGLLLEGDATNPSMQVDASLPFDDVTALKLEVFKTDKAERATVLRQLDLERIPLDTTNIALGCPVRTSHPLPDDMPADFLTDGLGETEVRPPAPHLGALFYYEIDLKHRWELDHLHFRFESDPHDVTRFSQIRLELYDNKPGPGVKPVWKAYFGEGAVHADSGNAKVRDIIGKAAGNGGFHGRYLRISSDSKVPFSPQLSEVEVYPSLVPAGVTTHANERIMEGAHPLEISAGTSWLSFFIKMPEFRDFIPLESQWRIASFRNEWLSGTASGSVESRCPAPGKYAFEARLRHTDGVWNAARLTVPLAVLVPIWQRPWMQLGMVMLIPALLALVTSWIGTRVMTRRVAELEHKDELSAERARIARDMHDAVGSQLTQLTVLHEIMAGDPALSEDHRTQLRQLAQTARSSVAALEEVVWAVNPSNDTLASTATYLTHAAREYMRPLGITCRQDVPHEWPERHLSSQLRHHLFLAFREALQNVVKHAQADEITVTLRFLVDESLFLVNIADDGIGLPSDTDGVEKDGLENMRDRLSEIGGDCRIRLRSGGGTIVEMKISIPA
ncbi:MAG: histidine kinase [Verrucomicrobiota bacterium]